MSVIQRIQLWQRFRQLGVACLLAGSIGPHVGAQAPPVEVGLDPATVPTDRLNEKEWADRHEAVVEEVRKHPDAELLLVGDSIIQNYEKSKLPDQNFQPTWNEFYEPRHALNLGYSGDTTANVLWRLDHGEVEGLHPKAVLLLIGTNNIGVKDESAEETEGGIDAVVSDLETRLPQTKILLLGILPSAISDRMTDRGLEVNRYLATTYAENPRVAYLDIGSIFYKDGKLDTAIFFDPRLQPPRGALHPDTAGQKMMAEAIEPTLAKLMGEPPIVPLASMIDINTALIPVPQLEPDSYDWYARHHAEIELQKILKPQVVLIGDSITHFWGGRPFGNHVNGPNSWANVFANMRVINMGFGWDRTQNVLWRLRQGEFAGISPASVILAIGTNNLTPTANARANTPAEIVDSIAAICKELHERSPASRIFLMAILPRGPFSDSPLRKPIRETNRLLALRFASDRSITYLDMGAKFLSQDGSLPSSLVPGGTHPSDAGYQIWADTLIGAGVRP